MKYYVLLGLAALLTVAQASANVGPGQNMVYWTTYRLEVEAYGSDTDSMMIAPGCKGSAVHGRCNFDEFLSYIVSGRTPTTYITQLADKWNVDGRAALNELERLQTTKRAEIDRLIPSLPGGRHVGYDQCLSKIQKSIERAGKSIRDSGRDTATLTWLQNYILASEEVIAIRSREQAAGFLRDFREFLEEKNLYINMTLQPKKWKLVSGKELTWDEIDWKNTLRKIKNPRIRTLAKQFHADYNSPTYTSADGAVGIGQSHAVLVANHNQLQLLVHGLCP